MSPSTLRVGVVDSEPDARAATRRVLSAMPSVAIVGEYGDVAEAAQKAPAARPDILIIEVTVNGSAAGIESLAHRLSGTALVATAADASPEFIVQVLRAGALEVVRRPVEQRELLAALDKVARLRGRPIQRQPGRVTAVFSTKGGLGITTLAVNLAGASTEHPTVKSALLVELTSGPSDVVTFLDLQPRYNVVDVLENVDRMDESLLQGLTTKHGSGLCVLPAPSKIDRGALLGDRVHAALDLLRMH